MMMTFLCIGICLFLLAVLLRCLAFIVIPACRSLSRWQALTGLLSLVVIAVFLMRPHEHVFQGLDSSGYRNMEKALEAGRPLTGVDTVLLEVPESLRVHMLLLPDMRERNTRDRSFQVMSPRTANYKPFFYPLLPMAMRGMDVLVPGEAADYFIPLISTLFCGTLLVWALSRMGWLASLAVPALLFISPLPAWLMRGCYVETVSGIFLSTALLVWLDAERLRKIPLAAYLALGLAVSFHPVMMIPAICLAAPMLLTEPRSARIMMGLLALLAGLIPIVVLTIWVCQPYGGLTLTNLLYGTTVSASIQSAVIGAALAGIITASLIAMRRPVMKGVSALNLGSLRYGVSAVLVTLTLLPTCLAVTIWIQKDIVRQGLFELYTGVQAFPAVILLALGVIALIRRRQSALGVLAVGLALPMFLYLKGAEQMGLWSQRRLIAPYLLYLTAILPTVCWLSGHMIKRGRFRFIRVVLLLLILAGLAMAKALEFDRDATGALTCRISSDRWIAPYRVQFEKGADEWVRKQRAAIGSRLTVSDSFAYTLPLAVDGKTRIVGLNEKPMLYLPRVMDWVTSRIQEEEVLWFTPFNNPGMEAGLVFTPFQPAVTQMLKRARAKYALPAMQERVVFQTQLLKIAPIDTNALPVMDKFFDGGPLGLRKPWGRSDIPIRLGGGINLPACWSRERSGIVGPVPPPGGSVHITIQGVNARSDDLEEQALLVTAPWGGEPVVLSMPRVYGSVEGMLHRGMDVTNSTGEWTGSGIYRISSTRPYDPARSNIKGFNRDLGALIHRIRIEVSSTNQP